MAEYVYTMSRVSKIVPPKRQILKDISLSFFPGAKIGVLGLNGAGKSTLLRIMAGIDTDIDGDPLVTTILSGPTSGGTAISVVCIRRPAEPSGKASAASLAVRFWGQRHFTLPSMGRPCCFVQRSAPTTA